MKLNDYHIIYLIGVGGIGMSALARWFISQDKSVFGYDKTPTQLTDELIELGIDIHFKDSVTKIPEQVLSESGSVLVIYTPAIPSDHEEFNHLKNRGFPIMKRSEVLGEISRENYTVAIAGTHGKTTTSTMLSHLLRFGGKNVTAFLGGISVNYNSNFIEGDLSGKDGICVVEADEYDRSFLRLFPDYAVLTAMDADHLDIYDNAQQLDQSFNEFLKLVPDTGQKLTNYNLENLQTESNTTYGIDQGSAYANNLKIEDDQFKFDYSRDGQTITDLILPQPGYHNVENAVAAITVCLDLGLEPKVIKDGLLAYKGVKRRFEYIINTPEFKYVDDYAHHPVEIEAFIGSMKALYPKSKLTAVFQPHLFSRTRDFAEGFATSLDKADEVFLLDIYPAREAAIPNVTSEIIFDKMKLDAKHISTKSTIMQDLGKVDLEVLTTIGAGDIDQLVQPIKSKFLAR